MTALQLAAQNHIAAELGWDPNARLTCESVTGGYICAAYRLETAQQCVFVKAHAPARSAMFDAESKALEVIAETAAVRVPKVLACGANNTASWLVLEWLELGPAQAQSHADLGRSLAHMHRVTAPSFGWRSNNFVGTNLQSNRRHASWADFFTRERLGVQRDIAASGVATRSLASELTRLIESPPRWLIEHQPQPSLLHGDLWGGNWAALASGEPVIFDPASYYGDRDADLAMTELFGGFDSTFYDAYDAVWPRSDGYATRRDLYQLYHLANHANLFGGSYIDQARHLAAAILAT